jgi:regulator of sirC expression with transglutaminase-like and TPR domain
MRHRHDLIDLSDIGEQSDDEIDLAAASLRLAMFEYPTLDVAAHLSELDRYADRALALVDQVDSQSALRGVDAALFDEAGFRGNAEHYYDPRNSYFNDVLRRKLGIPITLSIVYMEVARRIGLRVDGVAFPGHFFCVHRTGRDVEYIDPFDRGTRLDANARERLAGRTLPKGTTVSSDMLRPAPRRLVLIRVLRNLHAIYSKANDAGRVVAVLDRLLQIHPGDLEALHERGTALQRLGELSRARSDLEAYLELSSNKDGNESATKTLAAVRRSLADRN